MKSSVAADGEIIAVVCRDHFALMIRKGKVSDYVPLRPVDRKTCQMQCTKDAYRRILINSGKGITRHAAVLEDGSILEEAASSGGVFNEY